MVVVVEGDEKAAIEGGGEAKPFGGVKMEVFGFAPRDDVGGANEFRHG